MKSVGSYEARTHLPRLLSRVEQGESITITKRGKPIAVLSSASEVRTVIQEFRAFSKRHAKSHDPISIPEIKDMIEEGRP